MSNDSKTKQTSTSQTSGVTTGTNVTTPNIPTWLQTPIQNTIGSLAGTNPSTYTPETSSALQTTANQGAFGLGSVGSSALAASIAAAMGLTGAATPTYAATGYTPATTSQVGYKPVTINGTTIDTADIQRLMDPNLGAVVNTTLAGFDRQAGQDQASLDAQSGLNSGAFGGSGYALQKSNLTGLNALNRASTEAQLRQQAYTQALGGAQYDATNLQQASLANQAAENAAKEFTAQAGNTGLLANQAALNQAGQFNAGAANTAAGANQSAQLTTTAQQLAAALGLGQLGSTQNSIAQNAVQTQAGLGATQYAQDTAAQQYPLQYQNALLQALLGTGGVVDGSTSNLSGTTSGTSNGTTTTTSSPGFLTSLSQLAGLGSISPFQGLNTLKIGH